MLLVTLLRPVAIVLSFSIPSAAFAATFTVTSTADSGVGTLRETISSANASADNDTIGFDIPGADRIRSRSQPHSPTSSTRW